LGRGALVQTQPSNYTLTMEIVGYGLLAIGFIIMFIYGIQILIMAFQESVLWGIGYLVCAPVPLIFIIMHWQQTKKPFLMSLIGIPFVVVGSFLVPHNFNMPAS
jgi:hypothetical protein